MEAGPVVSVSAEQLHDFEDQGWFVADGVFTAEECDEIVGHLEATPFEVPLGAVADGQMS